MTARVGKQVRVVKGEAGKAKLVRKVGYASKRAHLKAARLEKSWKEKGSK